MGELTCTSTLLLVRKILAREEYHREVHPFAHSFFEFDFFVRSEQMDEKDLSNLNHENQTIPNRSSDCSFEDIEKKIALCHDEEEEKNLLLV